MVLEDKVLVDKAELLLRLEYPQQVEAEVLLNLQLDREDLAEVEELTLVRVQTKVVTEHLVKVIMVALLIMIIMAVAAAVKAL